MKHNSVMAFLLVSLCLANAATAQEPRKQVELDGVVLGMQKVREYRQLSLGAYSRSRGTSLLTDAMESEDEYQFAVKAGEITLIGHFEIPWLVKGAASRIQSQWPEGAKVQVRLTRKGFPSRSGMWMRVKNEGGKKMTMEVVSVVGADGSQKCKIEKKRANCGNALER